MGNFSVPQKNGSLKVFYRLSQKLQKRTCRATLIENAREGKGRRCRGMGWGRQGSVIIHLTDIRKEIKEVGKNKIFKVRKMETEYLKLLAIKE